MGADFPNWNTWKIAWRRAIFTMDGGNFLSTKRRGKNLVEWAGGLSTACAQEMQKGDRTKLLPAASEESVGMLRLRKKDRFALLLSALSMTAGFSWGRWITGIT